MLYCKIIDEMSLYDMELMDGDDSDICIDDPNITQREFCITQFAHSRQAIAELYDLSISSVRPDRMTIMNAITNICKDISFLGLHDFFKEYPDRKEMTALLNQFISITNTLHKQNIVAWERWHEIISMIDHFAPELISKKNRNSIQKTKRPA